MTPRNVFLTKAGAKLLDFGLAKLKPVGGDAGLTGMPTQSAGLTGEGAILGTLQYMAPEQLEGKEADARTDIFAFGAVVYEMVTGTKAFEGTSQASLISAILRDDPRPMTALTPVSPSALDRLVGKCLGKDPENRWQTARDVTTDLTWLTTNAPPAGGADVVAGGSRPKLAWGIASAAGLLALVFAGLYFLGYIRVSQRA